MTKTEMEDAIRNCTSQLDAVRQILPTLATKKNLERFATKQDLERFATKQDLERFPTKVDFESLREDVRGIADTVADHSVRLDAIERRFDRHDLRFDAILDALTGLTTRLEQKGVI